MFGQVKVMAIGHILKVTHQGAELWAKSDVCDCLVRINISLEDARLINCN